jgi:hypothetical protein
MTIVTGRPRFTVHLDFVAADADAARTFAAGLTEGLGALYADVDAFSAVQSPATAGLAECTEPVFCGAVGLDGRVCRDLHGNAGLHGNAAGWLRMRCSPGRVEGSDAPMAEVGTAGVSGYRLGGIGRPADLPLMDYER